MMEFSAEVGPSGYLPRLPRDFYRGEAFVLWTHTVRHRGKGWLSDRFHSAFREIALHAMIRERLACPVYVLMPDHLHLIWIGTSSGSDQWLATRFLRAHLGPVLYPWLWQHQAHDHVLRGAERRRGALTAACHYVAQNPVRAGLAAKAQDWPYAGAMVAGYPRLDPHSPDFENLFWRIAGAAEPAV